MNSREQNIPNQSNFLPQQTNWPCGQGRSNRCQNLISTRAFDATQHDILISKLKKHRLDQTATEWLQSSPDSSPKG